MRRQEFTRSYDLGVSLEPASRVGDLLKFDQERPASLTSLKMRISVQGFARLYQLWQLLLKFFAVSSFLFRIAGHLFGSPTT